MAERDMTPEERERFEKEILHEDNGEDVGGPASDPEVGEEHKTPEAPIVLPNPD